MAAGIQETLINTIDKMASALDISAIGFDLIDSDEAREASRIVRAAAYDMRKLTEIPVQVVSKPKLRLVKNE